MQWSGQAFGSCLSFGGTPLPVTRLGCAPAYYEDQLAHGGIQWVVGDICQVLSVSFFMGAFRDRASLE